MADVHPDWQLHDETPVPVRIANPEPSATPARTRVDAVRVSRLPGAMIGIFLTLAIGLAATRSAPLLLEQAQNFVASLTEDPFAVLSSAPASSTASSFAVAQADTASQATSSDPMSSATDSASSAPSGEDQLGNIPENPFTVSTASQGESGDAGAPSSLHPAASETSPRPPSQPASGPDAWLAIVGAIAAMSVVWKRCVRHPAVSA